MAELVRVSERHVECERQKGADDEHLEHEVVKCGDEELAEALGLQRLSIVITKVFSSFNQVSLFKTPLQINFQLMGNALRTYTTSKL